MELNEQELLEQIRASIAEQAAEEGIELDEAQLDELSKTTLKSYVKKATTSKDRAWTKADKEEDKAMSTNGDKYPEKQARHMAAANKEIGTWNKRRKGLDNANKKLSEEELDEHLIDVLGEEAYAQLDELSKKTLGNYIRGAEEDGREHEFNGGAAAANRDHNAQDHHQAKARKRSKGINTAVKKLTRESIEEMIAAAHEGKPVEFASAFDTALRTVIDDKIEDQRHSVAAGLFGDKE